MIAIKHSKIRYCLILTTVGYPTWFPTFIILLLICSPLPALHQSGTGPGDSLRRAELADNAIPRLEKVLKENIASFWLTKSLDIVNCGYTINFGPNSEPKGPGTKMIVTQARTMWLFARLARAGYGGDECIDAAEHGYSFLKEKMWDEKNGGFYWEVDATGNEKLEPKKHLYGQSFALYAISEYYLATKRQDVLDFATRFFELLEEKSHDKKYGGYIEYFNEDWTPVPDEEISYMGAPAGMKLMNTHLHLLEAMTTFYRASKLPLARERLLELINIASNAVVRKNLGACTDKYDRDWTPRLEAPYARVSYGHDIENIWLLMDACDAAGPYTRSGAGGISNYPFGDLYRTLFDYSYKYGYDRSAGGFYESGPFNQPADMLTKVWWVQAEALISSLYMNRFTNEPKYLDTFEQTCDYVEKHVVDWQHGEWNANVTPTGAVQGDKANIWKAGYHDGRAMIECLQILKQWKK
jgi:mannobiose 2-epimerase